MVDPRVICIQPCVCVCVCATTHLGSIRLIHLPPRQDGDLSLPLTDLYFTPSLHHKYIQKQLNFCTLSTIIQLPVSSPDSVCVCVCVCVR